MLSVNSCVNAPASPYALLLLLLAAVLGGCSNSDDNNNNNIATATLGVPGAGNANTVAVPPATLDGPLAGKAVLVSTFFSLASQGYEQAEYLVSGTANAYTNVNEFDSDGQWQVQASDQAHYKTRIVVNRPIDPADFNGTVFVEWLNVSAGFDSAPEWGMLHTELIRQGYAWVGVTAQKVGVNSLLDGSAAALVGGDANRYTDLYHPGDQYAFDIYSQIAQAIRAPGDAAPLNLTAQRLIAAGESQSAHYLMTYVNAFAPMHALFEGYFVHSRLASSAGLAGKFLEDSDRSMPEVVRVRADLGTPVIMLQTETDLFVLGSYPSNQSDSSNFRLWEVAGTAHADLYTFLDNRVDVGDNPDIAAVVENANPIPGIIDCAKPVNAGPQHFVANAAVRALNTWLVEGTPPEMADRFDVAGSPATFVLDELGNVKGGVRTPYVDAPIAILSGEGQPRDGAGFCFLSGTTVLFDASTLGSLYADNAAYIQAVNSTTDDAVDKGFLIPEDAALIKTYAAGSDIFAR